MLSFKGIPIHVCSKAPKDVLQVAIPGVKNCPYCGERYETMLIDESNNKDDKHTFEGGATSSGKYPRYDLIPFVFLRRTAERFTLGAEKHGDFNYRKSITNKAFIIDRLNHAMVHLKLATDLINSDQPFTDDDLGGVACNIAMAMEYQEAVSLPNTGTYREDGMLYSMYYYFDPLNGHANDTACKYCVAAPDSHSKDHHCMHHSLRPEYKDK